MPMPLSGLAQTLSNSVASVQSQIVDTQNQLSAGEKTLNPGQAGVVTRLSAQASGYDQTLTNIGSAQSVISVAQASLTSIASILTQMQSLANQSSSASLQSADRDSLNATFSNLAGQVSTLGTSASVNSNNLLSGNSLAVTTGIDGSSAAQTTVNGVNIATVAATLAALQINASAAAPTNVTTANVHQVDTFAITGTASATGSVTIGGLTFTTTNALATADQIGQAFADYISGTSATNANGTFSGATVATMQGIYQSAVNTSGSLALTFKAAGSQTATAKSGTISGVTVPTASPSTPTNQVDTVTFSSGLSAGQSVSVGGLIYTATSTASSTDIALDYKNYIASGTSPGSKGTFSGTSRATMFAEYTATQSGAVLTLTNKYNGVQTAPVTQDNGISNAAAAVSSITTLLGTVSTGQATLSASATGLTAQASANTALKTGLTNTVNSIQNIDATAMQAKLQQLNNQQSIDYYLVSQMNTEAAAILSIFR
ncbi:hypothetical protein G6701_07245 [Polynucleobacter paneuropaeus]|nr:hypothetical protein [Polynucleobacter paneuropaeus]